MCTLKVVEVSSALEGGDPCFAVDSAMDKGLQSSVRHGLVACCTWKVPGCYVLGLVVRSCVGPNRMCGAWDGSVFVDVPVGAGATPECCVSVVVGPLPEIM